MVEDLGQVAPVVVPATWRDLRAVMVLERLCFPEDAWPWIDLVGALTFPETVRLKAALGDRTLGFTVGDRRSREDLGWIATLGVHPDYRRRGIGGLLLARCEAELAVGRVRLTLRPSNLGARRLYERAGYHQIDLWPRYYRNGEDGVVMEKVIASAHPSREAGPLVR